MTPSFYKTHDTFALSNLRHRRITENYDKVAHGLMIAIKETMKEGIKFKNECLEDDRNLPKLFMVQYLNLEQPMEKSRRGKNRVYRFLPSMITYKAQLYSTRNSNFRHGKARRRLRAMIGCKMNRFQGRGK
ncbi:hypothetical protein M9H77_23164 [Catharanthus roseus]|uniref:Uncharacterized protein n=1 Tax=Catharanthus roseus TaxID=4058 RepID=A0ACC0AWJ9_CATRO|nr:hypothetical protein M9H77_23164 [Catharanthus roseus]